MYGQQLLRLEIFKCYCTNRARALDGERLRKPPAAQHLSRHRQRRVGEVDDLIHVSEVSAYRLHREARGVHRGLTGIAATSGTNTDSRSSEETPPEPYDDSAKAEQPRPIATVRKTHSSFYGEQNLPKRRPERVEVGSVFSPALP